MSLLIATSATSALESAGPRVRLSLNYVRSLEGAGLVPVIVPPLTDPSHAAEILAAAGGLLLTGGEDVDPARYGAVRHHACGTPHIARDATELALLATAQSMRLPVLAVCRGIQILNVAFGGTLIQDLPTQRPSAVDHNPDAKRSDRTHRVLLVPGTSLAAAVGERNDGAIDVNSYHHQAVDRLATTLLVSATATDGAIEGVESTDSRWWCVGVQWHPEDLTNDVRGWDRGIFRAFADAVRGRVAGVSRDLGNRANVSHGTDLP